MHCLPTADRVFGTEGLWVVDEVKGRTTVGVNGLEVLVLEKGFIMGLGLNLVVGIGVWRGG